MKSFAIDDMGIIQVHRYMVDKELREKQLIEIKLKDYRAQTIDVNAYYHKKRYVQPKIKLFIELIKKMQVNLL